MTRTIEQEIPKRPTYITQALPPLSDGRMRGINGSMWVYFSVPMSAVTDTKDAEYSRAAGDQLDSFFRGLASLASGLNRRMARPSYRDFQLLWLGIPSWFEPPKHLQTARQLARWFYDQTEQRLELLVGVRLSASTQGQSFFEACEGVFETFLTGKTPNGDFDKDFRLIADLAARSGLRPASKKALKWADAWWSHGVPRSVPIVPCEDHMHLFQSAETRREVEKYHDVADCSSWQELEGQSAMSFAVAEDFDYNNDTVEVGDEFVRFGPELSQQGARVISIRGSVEPAKLTRQELESQARQHKNDADAAAEIGKKTRGEVDQHIRFLEELEDLYAKSKRNAPPTLVDLSMIVGFDGIIEDVQRIQAGPVTLLPASNIVSAAWHETMLCSGIDANPIKLELPSTAISYGGLQDRSRVGDEPVGNVALAGFTDDKQPVWISPTAASHGDTYPYFGLLGATGSGKQCVLSTRIPTPSGWTTFGEVEVGDQVLGRDGKPCRVTSVSDIDAAPELYRIRLSDGQTIIADANHQWVVSSRTQRCAPKKASRIAAAERREYFLAGAAELDRMASISDDKNIAIDELIEMIDGLVPWKGQRGVANALRMTDCPLTLEHRTVERNYSKTEARKTDTLRLYRTADVLKACITQWTSMQGGNAVRWQRTNTARTVAAEKLLALTTDHERSTVAAIARDIEREHGHPDQYVGEAVRRCIAASKLEYEHGPVNVVVPLPSTASMALPILVAPARTALHALALRLRQKYEGTSSLDVDEDVLTTAEIIEQGVTVGKHRNFSIDVARAIELPRVELPIEPYIFGAWLGDGSSYNTTIFSADTGVVDRIAELGWAPDRVVTDGNSGLANEYVYHGRTADLTATGIERKGRKFLKRIPMLYQRAAREDRLELLRGLMDTDGHISVEGNCELSLCNRSLAEDTLTLIRSLGIKATFKECNAGLTEVDPDQTGGKRYRVIGTRFRINFTTNQPVFTLSRKVERLPTNLRDTADRLYIESIEPVLQEDTDYESARCISVDSPDQTYLAADFVPTHNTMVGQWLGWQWSRNGAPVMLFDPKPDSDLSPVAMMAGGTVTSVDSMLTSDGILDPLRYSTNPVGEVPLATSICGIALGRDQHRYENELNSALIYGVNAGARGIGVALRRAHDDGVMSDELFKLIMSIAESSSMFRATFALEENGKSLSVDDSFTLIRLGQTNLRLPKRGTTVPLEMEPLETRLSVNLARMIVRAGISSLRGRGGVLMMDEAWVLDLAAPDELEEVGRLARQFNVLPVYMTQTPTSVVNGGLAGYFSRGLIGHLKRAAENAPDEAQAAMDLYGISDSHIKDRIQAESELPSGAGTNWNTLKALWDNPSASDRTLLRPPQFYHSDLKNSIAPTTIEIPQEFMDLASTNPEDVKRRMQRMQSER